MIGFTYYNELPVVTVPTTQEILATLSGAQKLAILNGFANKVLPKTLGYQIGVKRDVIAYLYALINQVEESSRAFMRGEVVITPAVIEDGVEITPAVYNTVPTTQTQLLTLIAPLFSVDLLSAQVNAILAKMIAYSKHDGTGDWDFYSVEVKK